MTVDERNHMLFDRHEIRESVRLIARQLAIDPALHDDLFQEALIHLWLREESCPGQSTGWYLQSCRFHLKNHLRCGRSVDSPRHFRVRQELPEHGDAPIDSWHDSMGGTTILDQICARELCSMLSEWITPVERQILACLTDGLGMREIGQRLGVSHTFVIQHRRKIASLALKLGFVPPARSNPTLHRKPRAKPAGPDLPPCRNASALSRNGASKTKGPAIKPALPAMSGGD